MSWTRSCPAVGPWGLRTTGGIVGQKIQWKQFRPSFAQVTTQRWLDRYEPSRVFLTRQNYDRVDSGRLRATQERTQKQRSGTHANRERAIVGQKTDRNFETENRKRNCQIVWCDTLFLADSPSFRWVDDCRDPKNFATPEERKLGAAQRACAARYQKTVRDRWVTRAPAHDPKPRISGQASSGKPLKPN